MCLKSVLNILGNNKLSAFDIGSGVSNQSLKFLDVSRNPLKSLDVSNFTILNSLLLDSTHVTTIIGLKSQTHVERISWRYQSFKEENKTGLQIDYNCCIEARRLNLSSTRLLDFTLNDRFLRLERLDLASCGLKNLMDGFGHHVPNLRYLNLNFNAISDIRPLLGIQRLVELYVVGNRLDRFRRTLEVIAKIGSHLKTVDCRNNPFTVGYYLPQRASKTQQVTVRQNLQNTEEEKDPFSNSSFLVPAIDAANDQQYLQQLDSNTSLHRRVYELMLGKSCGRLENLDGLPLNIERIVERDEIWNRLVELGVVEANEESTKT
jgi:protein NUD1